MSHRDEPSEKPERMALSYTHELPAPSQTLPSFRELLPPHLHDEIEAAFPSASARHHSHHRPLSSSFDFTLDSRSFPFQHGYAPLAGVPLADAPRAYRASSAGPNKIEPIAVNDYRSRQPAHVERPSPILPPIRDLQSSPERPLNVFPGSAITSRPDRHSARGLPAGHLSSPSDRQSLGSHSATAIHNQQPYPYLAVANHSDSELQSLQTPLHGRQATYGITGDMVDSKGKRRRGNLPKPITDILRAWFHEHLDHPYPSEEDKQMFMTRTGLSISQISNWFINARRRQLPALRNQMRSGAGDSQHPSLSDEDAESLHPRQN